ncbi:hypothetical protein EGT07_02660 [Herbaspirillum sp. HC18]|nr:hypothetical protein EGT07_02660 [Herbaspirillum sp. HC18]
MSFGKRALYRMVEAATIPQIWDMAVAQTRDGLTFSLYKPQRCNQTGKQLTNINTPVGFA